MNRKTQKTTAACLLSGSIILIGGVIYLAFVFPKTGEEWMHQARQLSTPEMFMVNVSHLTIDLGLPVLGLLMFSIVASLVWLVVAIQAKRKDSANQQMHGTAYRRP